VAEGSFSHDAGTVVDEIRWGPWPGPGWTTLTRGAHVRADLAGDVGACLRAWQLALPFWASFTGLTVARLRHWWTPPLPEGLPLFVTSGRADRIHRRGLHVCRHDVLPAWELIDGVRVTPAAETILACARDLSLLDVIVLGDAGLHAGHTTMPALRRVARLRRRGSPLLRSALPLMDPRAESAYESLLRVLHVVCEVAVESQFAVVDDDGEVTARADLRIIGTQRLAEYDGADHLLRRQLRKDLRRVGRISDAGYERRGYTKEDVLYAPGRILKDADVALGREHDPSRIHAWHDLLRDSLFTPAGQARLRRRLRMPGENAEQPPA
jgi:hypothetical protein